MAYPKYVLENKLESEYKSYHAAKERCTNPNSSAAKNYFARGIKFELPAFDKFMQYMGRKPAGFTLERIDNNGNYILSNVIWADRKVQANNRRQPLPRASQYPGVVVQNMGYKVMVNGKKVGYRKNLADAIELRKTYD